MKRTAGFVIALAVILAVLWLIKPVREVAMSLGSSGADAIEAWCGEQTKALANEILRPQLRFADLVYRAPATVVFMEMELVDGGVPFLTAREARVTFAEVPEAGQRLIIEAVELEDSTLLLRTLADGVLLGFNDFFDADADLETATDEAGSPLSTSFAVRRVRVINGAIAYELADGNAMRLDEINVEMDCDPETDPGWYAVNLDMNRRDLVTLKTTSRLNIDDVVLEIEKSTFEIALAPERYEVLPPQLQELVREHEVRGHLTLRTQGTLPLTKPIAGDLQIEGHLENASASFDAYVVPAESLDLRVHLQHEKIGIEQLAYAGLGGSIELDGMLLPQAGWGFEVNLQVHGVRIEQLFRPVEGEEPKYAGRIDLEGVVRGVLSNLRNQLRGAGDGTVEEGRLVNFPLMGVLVGAVGGEMWGQKDHLKTHLELYPDRVEYTDLEVVSAAIGARGKGTQYFDGRWHYTVNAGPLVRAETSLGPIGDLFGKVTDTLMKYEITGQGDESNFDVKPFGIGAD
jgi:hypothetical protein